MKNTFTLLAFLLTAFYAQAQFTITNTDNFVTMEQLLLANEINESGEPFAEALGYDLDELDPMVLNSPDSIAYTLGIENYEYSRYQLGTIVTRSGMGLHMMWAPAIMNMAANEPDGFDGSFTGGTPNGFNEDDELRKNIMHFGMGAHQMAPAHPWPQFAEFMQGDPHLPQPVAENFATDFGSLRWDRSKMDKTLNPGAMGQSMMKQYLWAQDMLGGFHDENDEPVTPDGTNTPDFADGTFNPDNNIYLGGDNLDGFIGQVLTAEAINKTLFLVNKLAYDGTALGGVDPATYTPADGIKFFPHEIAVTEGMVMEGLPPRAMGLSVVDPSSDLFDQLSLLWAANHFRNMMDPNNNSDEQHIAYHSVFDGDPFPADASVTGAPGPFNLMMGTGKVVFLNMMTMHFNGSEGTFVNTSNLNAGAVEMGNSITAVNAGYALVMLTKFAEEYAGTPLEPMAVNAINAQAGFIMSNMKDPNGGYYNSYTIGEGPSATTKKTMAQAAIARGMYAAYAYTNNADYLAEAENAYAELMHYYRADQSAFLSEKDNLTATYTPYNFAIITGALREAALVGGHSDAALVYTRFFKEIANKMQLSEGPATGEMGNDSDEDLVPFIRDQTDQLPPVFAQEATMVFEPLATSTTNDFVFNLTSTPNPFNEETKISFFLKKSSQVRIQIYNLQGSLIETIQNNRLTSGYNEVSWKPINKPTGVYYYQVMIDDLPPLMGKTLLVK